MVSVSKNSQQKQKAKRKATKLRAQRQQDNLRKGEECLLAMMNKLSEIPFSEKIKPGPNSVRFIGITSELLLRATAKTSAIVKTDLPLDDFVLRVKSGDCYAFDIHWLPYESPLPPSVCEQAFRHYGKVGKTVSGTHFRAGDEIISTIYAHCRQIDITLVVYLYRSQEIDEYSYIYFTIGSSDVWRPSEETQDRIANFIFFSVLLSQYLTVCHIKDLPVDFEPSQEIEDGIKKIREYEQIDYDQDRHLPHKNRPVTPKRQTKGDCVAYIHYHAEDDSISISHRPHKGYKLRWWIVSEHKRHLADGRVIAIPAYIKGEKDDEDAIRALDLYHQMQKRTTCFKVVPRT